MFRHVVLLVVRRAIVFAVVVAPASVLKLFFSSRSEVGQESSHAARTAHGNSRGGLTRHFTRVKHRAVIIDSPTKSRGRKMHEKSPRTHNYTRARASAPLRNVLPVDAGVRIPVQVYSRAAATPFASIRRVWRERRAGERNAGDANRPRRSS